MRPNLEHHLLSVPALDSGTTPQTPAAIDMPRRVRCRHWVSWSQARWTAREADVAAARRRAAEGASRELARRDAQIADATANSRVAAAAAARALNEATAKATSCEAEIGRLRAAAEEQAAALAAAQQQVPCRL